MYRYFVDVFAKIKTDSGIKNFLIEIKPYSQILEPPKPKRKTKTYINEMKTYFVNRVKWKAAEEYCKNKGWIFLILTDKGEFTYSFVNNKTNNLNLINETNGKNRLF